MSKSGDVNRYEVRYPSGELFARHSCRENAQMGARSVHGTAIDLYTDEVLPKLPHSQPIREAKSD